MAKKEAEAAEKDAEIERLKEEIHDLKGNVWAFLRIRPTMPVGTAPLLIQNSRHVIHTKSARKATNLDHVVHTKYEFHQVCDGKPTATIIDHFSESIVACVRKGNNFACLAYGHTGAGKTFTMEGNI